MSDNEKSDDPRGAIERFKNLGADVAMAPTLREAMPLLQKLCADATSDDHKQAIAHLVMTLTAASIELVELRARAWDQEAKIVALASALLAGDVLMSTGRFLLPGTAQLFERWTIEASKQNNVRPADATTQ